MTLIELSLVVFAITLIVNKSQILANKREFVKTYYESSTLNEIPSFLHTFWYKMWTCSMCLGFWVSLGLCYHYREDWISSTLIVFGANWLIHCVENYLFQTGYRTEKLVNKELKEKD